MLALILAACAAPDGDLTVALENGQGKADGETAQKVVLHAGQSAWVEGACDELLWCNVTFRLTVDTQAARQAARAYFAAHPGADSFSYRPYRITLYRGDEILGEAEQALGVSVTSDLEVSSKYYRGHGIWSRLDESEWGPLQRKSALSVRVQLADDALAGGQSELAGLATLSWE